MGESISGYQFLEQLCLICRTEKMKHKIQGSIFGLFPRNTFVCNKCGTFFIEDGEKWKFSKTNEMSNSIWRKYGQKSFFIHEWINISKGGLSDTEQIDTDMQYLMEKFSSGALKIKIIRTTPSIILQNNEEVICALPNIYLSETRSVRITNGVYGGPSFRVAKGVSLRLGRSTSRGESHPEMRQIDRGSLIITNRRFIFNGTIKTVDVPILKIVQIDPLDDGIGLSKQSREKKQYFSWSNSEDIQRAVSLGSNSLVRSILEKNKQMGLYTNGVIEVEDQGRTMTIPLTGDVIKSLIEGAVKNIK